jgi:hypothetical protein
MTLLILAHIFTLSVFASSETLRNTYIMERRDSGSSVASFFTGDPEIFHLWRASLEDESVRDQTDPARNNFGSILPLVEQQLFGESHRALSLAAAVPIESDDDLEALFRSLFVVNIMDRLSLLRGENDQLSQAAMDALRHIATDCGVDPGELVEIVSTNFVMKEA